MPKEFLIFMKMLAFGDRTVTDVEKKIVLNTLKRMADQRMDL